MTMLTLGYFWHAGIILTLPKDWECLILLIHLESSLWNKFSSIVCTPAASLIIHDQIWQKCYYQLCLFVLISDHWMEGLLMTPRKTEFFSLHLGTKSFNSVNILPSIHTSFSWVFHSSSVHSHFLKSSYQSDRVTATWGDRWGAVGAVQDIQTARLL